MSDDEPDEQEPQPPGHGESRTEQQLLLSLDDAADVLAVRRGHVLALLRRDLDGYVRAADVDAFIEARTPDDPTTAEPGKEIPA